jgi:hypothetical protein
VDVAGRVDDAVLGVQLADPALVVVVERGDEVRADLPCIGHVTLLPSVSTDLRAVRSEEAR